MPTIPPLSNNLNNISRVKPLKVKATSPLEPPSLASLRELQDPIEKAVKKISPLLLKAIRAKYDAEVDTMFPLPFASALPTSKKEGIALNRLDSAQSYLNKAQEKIDVLHGEILRGQFIPVEHHDPVHWREYNAACHFIANQRDAILDSIITEANHVKGFKSNIEAGQLTSKALQLLHSTNQNWKTSANPTNPGPDKENSNPAQAPGQMKQETQAKRPIGFRID